MKVKVRIQSVFANLRRFPWAMALLTLRDRLREDRLSLSASSLTFTTIIALVPLVTVALAVFTAFPIFAKFQDVLQKWLIDSLIPDNIARQVLGYLTQFSRKANQMGVAGLAVLFATALSLVFTIDRTFNGIWRVQKPRPWGQRLLIYWTALTLGPLVLACSMAVTSYLVSSSKGVVGHLPVTFRLLLDTAEFFFIAVALAGTYHYVPNTAVRWRDALIGGIFAALGLELAKNILALYIDLMPTYSAVYGAFATLPILLVWIYLAWLIVLLGAVLTAHLPSLNQGLGRPDRNPGWRFSLALELVHKLAALRGKPEAGLSVNQLSTALKLDWLQIQELLQTLESLSWVGMLQDNEDGRSSRYILLVDPASTPAEPLIKTLLLAHEAICEPFWEKADFENLLLKDLFQPTQSRLDSR